MKSFLNTALGSYLKVFLTAILVELSLGDDLYTFDKEMLTKLVKIGFLATIPILINWLNPNDPRYGNKKSAGDFPVESKDIKG